MPRCWHPSKIQQHSSHLGYWPARKLESMCLANRGADHPLPRRAPDRRGDSQHEPERLARGVERGQGHGAACPLTARTRRKRIMSHRSYNDKVSWLFLLVALLGGVGQALALEFAYVANASSNNVSAYSINAATGALTPVTGSPFPAGGGLLPSPWPRAGRSPMWRTTCPTTSRRTASTPPPGP